MCLKIIQLTAILFISAILLSFRLGHNAEDSKCMMAVTYSEMTYSQFKKAYKATSTENAQKAIKKGMDHAKETAAYAAQCNCTPAETYSLTAYTTAQKCLKQSSLEKLRSGVKKAMDLSLDAMNAALQCNK